MQKNLFRLTISAPEKLYEILTALLAMRLPYGWQEETGGDESRFIVHSEEKALLEDLAREIESKFPEASLETGELENTDWLSSWKEFFTPVLCGKSYVILPPWLAGEEYTGRKKIIINPGSAFGTGHHASTVLCLTALDRLLKDGRLHPGQSFLDLGCGTGVLGIGAALAGLHGPCVDIDPLAVENAKDNVKLNRVENYLEILEGSIELLQGQNFDLIMANILAGPLIDMAPKVRQALAGSGCLVLSGILASQADAVARAYMDCSLPVPERLTEGEWSALVWAWCPVTFLKQ